MNNRIPEYICESIEQFFVVLQFFCLIYFVILIQIYDGVDHVASTDSQLDF